MRYERKYRSEDLDLHEILQVVRDHPSSFRKLHPDRQVNNVYFDTPELHCLQENLHGVPTRSKYRIRWYGTSQFPTADVQLELKAKDGLLGDKLQATLPQLDWSHPQAWRKGLQAGFQLVHDSHSLPSGLAAEDLQPVLFNSYLRSYFVSFDGKYRLTLDRKLLFRGLGTLGQFYRFPYEDIAAVIEVKYEASDDIHYDLVGQRLPFRLSRNSKYSTGMALLGHG